MRRAADPLGRRARATAIVLLVCAAAPLVATAGGVRDLDDAWLVPPGALRAFLLPDRPASRWLLVAGQGTLYEVSDLTQAGLGVERRLGGARLALDWHQLGTGPYRERSWRLAAALGRPATVGVRVGLTSLDLAGGPARAHGEADLWWRTPSWSGAWLEGWLPLGPPPVWYGRQGLRRWLRCGAGGEAWTAAVVVDRAVDGRPSVQGELLLRLAAIAAVGLRCEPATGTVGLSTAWRVQGQLLRTSHCVHPDLGVSHRWGLVVGVGR